MSVKLKAYSQWCGIMSAGMLPVVLTAMSVEAAAARGQPISPVIKSARTVSSLVQLLILSIFLILFFIFMVSLLVAIRRIMLARRRKGHEKTAHVDAWSLAGQRLKSELDTEADEDSPD